MGTNFSCIGAIHCERRVGENENSAAVCLSNLGLSTNAIRERRSHSLGVGSIGAKCSCSLHTRKMNRERRERDLRHLKQIPITCNTYIVTLIYYDIKATLAWMKPAEDTNHIHCRGASTYDVRTGGEGGGLGKIRRKKQNKLISVC